MSGLSGLSNHCRERSFLIWAAVGFFGLGIRLLHLAPRHSRSPTRSLARTCTGFARLAAHWPQPVGVLGSRHEYAGAKKDDRRRVLGLGRGTGRALGALQRRALSHGP